MGARDDLLAIPDALLRDGSIASAVLCQMDFGTGTKRWWAGFGDLQHVGQTWLGTGDLIEIGDLTTDYVMSATPVSISMAATSEMIARVRDQRTNVRERRVVIYDQLFATSAPVVISDPGDPLVTLQTAGPWQPLGSPLAVFTGTMGPLGYSADGPDNHRIKLDCEGLWVRRNAPPRGVLSDRDQKARHPGDKGLERLQIYTNYETRWI